MTLCVDRLLRSRALNRTQHSTAIWFRDAWNTAGIGEDGTISSEAAWQRYSRALAALPRDERRTVITVVIYDEGPVAWGRRWNCDGLAMLRRALDRMAIAKMARDERRDA